MITPQILWYYFQYYLWIAPHVLQLVLLWFMVHRGWTREFPMFFGYTVVEVLQFVLLFSTAKLFGFNALYLGVYSLGIALSAALRFGVVHEVLDHLFRNYPSLNNRGKRLFYWAGLVFLLIAVALVLGAFRGSSPLLLKVRAFDRSVSVLQCGLILFLFLFSHYFKLSWRSQTFGVALGMGILASTELAISAARLYVGPSGNSFLNFLSMATYHLCVLIWLFYFIASERPPQYNSTGLPAHDLESWNEELQRLIHK